MKRIFSCLLFSLLMPCNGIVSYADTLLLRSGDQLIGKIISEDSEKYFVDVNGIVLEVRRSDVTSITRKDDLSGYESGEFTSPDSVGDTTATIPPFGDESSFPSQTPQTETPTLTPTPLLPVVLPQGKAYQVTGSGVRFREGPKLDYPVVSTLLSRTILIEIETAEGWLHAKTLEGVEGWIHPNFVTPMENLPCLVTGDRVNVREAPGEVYRSLGLLRKGDIVLKLEERTDWWNVLTSDSIAGWCNKEYLFPLENERIYKPKMSAVRNSDVGTPILFQSMPSSNGQQKVTFTVRDENIVVAGIAKIIVFHKDKELFERKAPLYVSPDIFQRSRMKDSMAIMNTGMPEQLAVNFIGGDILTMLGHRVSEGWQYELTLPDSQSIHFGFVVQEGPAHGTLILVP